MMEDKIREIIRKYDIWYNADERNLIKELAELFKKRIISLEELVGKRNQKIDELKAKLKTQKGK